MLGLRTVSVVAAIAILAINAHSASAQLQSGRDSSKQRAAVRDSSALHPGVRGTVARLDSGQVLDSLKLELERLRAGRLRDSLQAQTEVELTATGIRLRGFPMWLALSLLLVATLAFFLATRTASNAGSRSLGVGAVLLVGTSLFMAGGWWARRSANASLAEMRRYYEVTAPWLTQPAPAAVAKSVAGNTSAIVSRPDEVAMPYEGTPANRVLTRGMLWTLILGTLMLAAAFVLRDQIARRSRSTVVRDLSERGWRPPWAQ